MEHNCHKLDQDLDCPACAVARAVGRMTASEYEAHLIQAIQERGRFNAEAFMEAHEQTRRNEVMHSAKVMIQAWTKEQQQELYVWMHDVLNCRVYD